MSALAEKGLSAIICGHAYAGVPFLVKAYYFFISSKTLHIPKSVIL